MRNGKIGTKRFAQHRGRQNLQFPETPSLREARLINYRWVVSAETSAGGSKRLKP